MPLARGAAELSDKPNLVYRGAEPPRVRTKMRNYRLQALFRAFDASSQIFGRPVGAVIEPAATDREMSVHSVRMLEHDEDCIVVGHPKRAVDVSEHVARTVDESDDDLRWTVVKICKPKLQHDCR